MNSNRIHDPFEKDMISKEFPPSVKEIHGDPYMARTLGQMNGELTGPSERALYNLSRNISDLHPEIDQEVLAKVIDKARNNLGLYLFLIDYGMASDFFIPWLFQIPRAISLEVAFGRGVDFSGKWRDIPREDPFYWWVVREGMFIYLRDRAINSAKLIQGKPNVLILGAGFLPELRYVGYTPRTKVHQRIVAVDSDGSIPTSEPFEGLKNLEGIDLDYRCESLLTELESPTTYDAIVMGGVMSYCYDKMLEIIWAAVTKLNAGGTFMFDLQLQWWNIVRDALVFDWKTDPPMVLIDDVDKVINVVAMRCRNLPVQVGHFIDRNHQSITFQIHKI